MRVHSSQRAVPVWRGGRGSQILLGVGRSLVGAAMTVDVPAVLGSRLWILGKAAAAEDRIDVLTGAGRRMFAGERRVVVEIPDPIDDEGLVVNNKAKGSGAVYLSSAVGTVHGRDKPAH